MCQKFLYQISGVKLGVPLVCGCLHTEFYGELLRCMKCNCFIKPEEKTPLFLKIKTFWWKFCLWIFCFQFYCWYPKVRWERKVILQQIINNFLLFFSLPRKIHLEKQGHRLIYLSSDAWLVKLYNVEKGCQGHVHWRLCVKPWDIVYNQSPRHHTLYSHESEVKLDPMWSNQTTMPKGGVVWLWHHTLWVWCDLTWALGSTVRWEVLSSE